MKALILTANGVEACPHERGSGTPFSRGDAGFCVLRKSRVV